MTSILRTSCDQIFEYALVATSKRGAFFKADFDTNWNCDSACQFVAQRVRDAEEFVLENNFLLWAEHYLKPGEVVLDATSKQTKVVS